MKKQRVEKAVAVDRRAQPSPSQMQSRSISRPQPQSAPSSRLSPQSATKQLIPQLPAKQSKAIYAQPIVQNQQDVLSIEKGILSLLSFLGHSFKKGTISDELYQQEKSLALQKLDVVRKSESEEEAEDFDEENAKRDKLLKNKNDVESLLTFLEDSYNEGTISEKSYRELKFENTRKLSRINKLLGKLASGDVVQLESPPEIYDRIKSNFENDEKTDEELGEDAEGYSEPQSTESDPEFIETPAPEIQEEVSPKVKPISFRDRLEKFSPHSHAEYDFPLQRSEADDIMAQLKVNPKKAGPASSESERSGRQIDYGSRNQYEDAWRDQANSFSDGKEGSSAEGVGQKTGAMLGKISGLVGKFKKGGGRNEAAQGAGAPAAAGAATNGSAGGAGTSGGTPSWADKLPEEMTPQELAEYNKAQAERASESSGDSPKEEDEPILSSKGGGSSGNSGGGGGASDGGGVSSGDLEKVVLELEKMKVKLETVESTRTVMEERIEHIMENIGELRTMLFEKESSSKEQEAKLDKFVEMVSDLEPQRFAKELDKRDKQISDQSLRLEKLETMTSDMAQNVNKIRQTLDAIGSLKNIATVSKDIADRSAKIDNTVSKVERLADETGRVYLELNRKLNEFTIYRGKQDILAESLKEIVAMTENLSNKLDNYVTKDDITGFKKDMEDTKLGITELQAKVELAQEGDELPPHITDLQDEKDALEQILESNEEEYLEGQIKEDEYKRIKDVHIKKLQIVRQKLKDELAKIRKERAAQNIQTKTISKDAGISTAETRETSETPSLAQPSASQTSAEESVTPEAEGPPSEMPPVAKAKLKKSASAKTTGKAAITKEAPTPKKIPRALGVSSAPSEEDLAGAPEEQEIEGEIDDEKLEQAEEIAQAEDEIQEVEENADETGEEPSEDEPAEPELPAQMPKQKLAAIKRIAAPKSAAATIKSPQIKTPLQQNGTAPANTAQKVSQNAKTGIAETKSVQKIPAKPQQSNAVSAPVPNGGMRISDIIKNAAEGRKVVFIATAFTAKKSGSQCLIKLSDDSGVIYGINPTSLKGQVKVVGTVAKDPQGVPFVKIQNSG